MNRNRAGPSTAPDESQRQVPIYARVTEVLRNAIDSGSIEPGTVLLEGHVAELLHLTRTPVRQALRELEEQGLVCRFDGRGFLAGPNGVQPQRVVLDIAMLGVATADTVRKTLGWEAIYDAVERDVVHLSVFGHYRLNEVERARHFGVGRIVARDVLLRLESLGLTEKDERLRWTVTPLDARRINHLYELRWLLEPAALRAAMASITEADVQPKLESLRMAMRAYPAIVRTELDQLEHDLHVELLAHCPNPELLQSLERTRCILTLSKHVLGDSAPMPKSDPFLSEHLAVLTAVARGDADKAQNLLRAHLEASCEKVTLRAVMVRNGVATPKLSYATA